MSAMFRAFSKEIKQGEAHHFLSKIDHTKSRQTAYNQHLEGRKDLFSWGIDNGIVDASISKLA
jgi:hypothetical protein